MDAGEERTDGGWWLEPLLPRLRAAGPRLLELGCGSGADAARLAERGFRVVACDRSAAALAEARVRAAGVSLFRADLRAPLPLRAGAFDAALASLSLHYLPWAETLAAVAAVRRVLRPGAPLLLQVNATDDVHFGAGQGEPVEPGLYRMPEASTHGLGLKRFFSAADVRAMLVGGWQIEQLTHETIARTGLPKQVWRCLALVTARPDAATIPPAG